jgi:hypothetical protein
MKKVLRILAIASGMVLPTSFAMPVFAQFSPYVPPSWYDYGIMRQQTINGGRTERQIEDYEESTGESLDSDQPTSDLQPEPDLIQGTDNHNSTGFSQEEYDFALQAYQQAVTEEGLPANEPATAIAFFVVANYMVATGQNGDTSNKVDQAIYNQIRQALAQDAQFQTVTAEDRQSMIKDLGAIGAMIYLSALSAQEQGDTQSQAQLRQVAQTNLESFLAAPLSKIRLTENGIVIQ